MEDFRRLENLHRDIKRKAGKLIHGKSSNPRAVGEEIYALADKADAALMNLEDPFSTAPAG
ncbi:MAG: hypothetical protein ABSA85_03520 [Terracidiphilus sp.]|jgi:hypothetical protein